MINVKFTPYRANLGTIMHRQTKGHTLTSLDGKYRFFLDGECKEPDIWVVQGKGMREGETCRVAPENTILLTTEPKSILVYPQKYIDQFGMICTCQEETKHKNVKFGPAILPWFVGYKEDKDGTASYTIDYDMLKDGPAPKKTKLISVITSNKVFTQGHIDRIRFVNKLKEHYGDQLDLYGRGFNDFDDKWDVMSQYKYHIVIENSSQQYYWTEKISDCYLAESFPFYYGCTNLADYYPSESFAQIDIRDPEGAIRMIDQAIAEDWYGKRQEALRKSKDLVLDTYNMFEYVARLCDQLDLTLEKKDVHINPCKSSGDKRNLWNYMFKRKFYELKYKLGL